MISGNNRNLVIDRVMLVLIVSTFLYFILIDELTEGPRLRASCVPFSLKSLIDRAAVESHLIYFLKTTSAFCKDIERQVQASLVNAFVSITSANSPTIHRHPSSSAQL